MPVLPIRPFWQTPDGESVRLYLGNVTDVLARLSEKSVQCACTSPPYWGLRSYSVETESKRFEIGAEPSPDCGTHGQAQCGACFVCSMVKVFRGVRRVLRDDGVLWLNLGDSYASGGRGGGRDGSKQHTNRGTRGMPPLKAPEGLKDGDMCGVPWRVALALQHDGWTLRSDLPWVKRSSMPESVVNRPAKALEYVFMLTKGPGYYFDMEAVRKIGPGTHACSPEAKECRGSRASLSAYQDNPSGRNFRQTDLWYESVDGPHGMVGVGDEMVGLDVTSRGYPGRHFAVFSEWLIDPLIRAATSERGACGECGAPWERVTETTRTPRVSSGGNHFGRADPPDGWEDGGVGQHTRGYMDAATTTVGWQPTCQCHGRFVTTTEDVVVLRRADFGVDPHERDHSIRSNRNGKDSVTFDPGVEVVEVVERQNVTRYVPEIPLQDHPVRPCRVLDPFIGSGTTCIASLRLGRWSWGIDLSEQYLREHAVKRVGERLIELNGPGELVGFNSAPVEW